MWWYSGWPFSEAAARNSSAPPDFRACSLMTNHVFKFHWTRVTSTVSSKAFRTGEFDTGSVHCSIIIARVVSWEISGNFLRKFSGNFRKNKVLFRKISEEIFRKFVIKNVMKHSKKCPQYQLIGYVRLKNSSITGKVIIVNMDLKSGHDLDGRWIDDGLTHGWLFSTVLLVYSLYQRYFSGKFPEIFRKISRILFSGILTTLIIAVCPRPPLLWEGAYSAQLTCAGPHSWFMDVYML